jgi:hypothetical protein
MRKNMANKIETLSELTQIKHDTSLNGHGLLQLWLDMLKIKNKVNELIDAQNEDHALLLDIARVRLHNVEQSISDLEWKEIPKLDSRIDRIAASTQERLKEDTHKHNTITNAATKEEVDEINIKPQSLNEYFHIKIIELRDENEKLQEKNKSLSNNLLDSIKKSLQLKRENEKLKAINDQLHFILSTWDQE